MSGPSSACFEFCFFRSSTVYISTVRSGQFRRGISGIPINNIASWHRHPRTIRSRTVDYLWPLLLATSPYLLLRYAPEPAVQSSNADPSLKTTMSSQKPTYLVWTQIQ